ncbi:MAG: hypothetical protein ACRCSR_10460 [Bacteroidales bacterium]
MTLLINTVIAAGTDVCLTVEFHKRLRKKKKLKGDQMLQINKLTNRFDPLNTNIPDSTGCAG